MAVESRQGDPAKSVIKQATCHRKQCYFGRPRFRAATPSARARDRRRRTTRPSPDLALEPPCNPLVRPFSLPSTFHSQPQRSSSPTLVLVAAVTMDINVFDLNLRVLERLERSEIDEVLTTCVLVFVAFGADQIIAARGRKREGRLQTERIRIVHVTMRTVQDIVLNCLTELQLLRLEADGAVSAEALSVFDKSIRVTSAKLRALGELKTFAEKEMAIGPGLATEADAT